MNLHAKLIEREADSRPVTVGLIGAGKFGTMFMAQVRLTRGMHLAGVADLDVARALSQLRSAGWPDELFGAASLADAHKKRTTFVTDNAEAVIADPEIEVRVEAPGMPAAGSRHALS
ncbi:MAG: flagellar biosynthesis protein FlgA, partial [Pseudolabrys sp.]